VARPDPGADELLVGDRVVVPVRFPVVVVDRRHPCSIGDRRLGDDDGGEPTRECESERGGYGRPAERARPRAEARRRRQGEPEPGEAGDRVEGEVQAAGRDGRRSRATARAGVGMRVQHVAEEPGEADVGEAERDRSPRARHHHRRAPDGDLERPDRAPGPSGARQPRVEQCLRGGFGPNELHGASHHQQAGREEHDGCEHVGRHVAATVPATFVAVQTPGSYGLT
jgi:hypothetical protein